MDFDFSNYTYSGLITIFSMIMGMAYPTVQSAIHEIDTKYDSGQLVEYFMTEVSYKWFRFWLALSILFALCCPFVLNCCKVAWVHYTWIFVHTVIVLALIASAIRLYTTIMTYYRSGRLVEYIKQRASNEQTKVASVLADISNFAAWKGQKKVYMAAVQAIADQLILELREHNYDINPAPFDIDNPSTFNSSLSADINRAIERLVNIIKNRNYDSFYTSDVTVVSLFYNLIEQHTLSQGIRDMIWRMVSDVTLSNNKEWVMEYWSIADGYARSLKYNCTSFEEANPSYADYMKIKEFHAAIGGMLIKYGKEKWLSDILFFTNSQPASYPLLSNTFSDILDMLEQFEKKLRYPYLWTIQVHYQMQGTRKGVNTDADIVRYIEQFIAIEFLRLWHIDYNGEYSDPKGMLQAGKNAEDNEKYLNLLERLQWSVNEVFDKNLNNTLHFNRPTKNEATQFINDNVQICKERLKGISDNPEIDDDKRKAIINSVKDAAKEWRDNEVAIINNRFNEVKHFVRTMPHKFPKEYILKNYALFYDSLGTSVVEGLKANFNSVLPSFFMICQATETYRIDYEHIGDALRRLGLNDSFAVLCLGFNKSSFFTLNKKSLPEAICNDDVWTFNGARFYELWGSGESSLIIIHKDDIPVCEVVKNDNDDVDLITDSMPIYSNIRKIDENTYMNVFYRIFIDVHYPTDMKFIRITIPNIYSENKYDLDNVQSIDSIFGKNLN